ESLGELFRGTRAEIIEKTLCERIALVFLKIVVELLEFLCIDVNESLRRLIAAKTSDKRLMILLNAINQLNNNNENPPNVT
ncbi:MAG: hypothetical protein LBG96_09990, partial [Tannerella sp.]|nr:hypothetical protein [Tannerella sp.]